MVQMENNRETFVLVPGHYLLFTRFNVVWYQCDPNNCFLHLHPATSIPCLVVGGKAAARSIPRDSN